MYLLGLEIRKDRRVKPEPMVVVTCGRCGRGYQTAQKNVRVVNYCANC